ncbi:hypothetical protein [Rheinheimera baltica]|uniref:hypothetical protein n=1 Tax=Rheinheimera baltica TaxID=67576 RepID=UPI00273E21E7|nr:hypothetical protein [Rheinheimera baltica]MDP5149613.1 hypothetical protein [Rheinheimera baltica]
MRNLTIKAKILCLATLLLSAGAANAQSNWSIGHGYASGGVVGAQYQWLQDDIKWTAALGLFGAAVGVQRSIDDARQHSIGLAAGIQELTAEDGFFVATYQYYPSGFANSGWRLGFSAGMRREDRSSFFASVGETETKPVIAFELGYQF